MSNDTEATMSAIKQIGAAVTKACNDTGVRLAAFGVAFDAAYEKASQDQALRFVSALDKR